MHTNIITNDLSKVVKGIESNEVIAFPTGTVYGLAVNALSEVALSNLRIIKNRPKEKSFTVFLNDSGISNFFEISKQENLFLKRAKNLPLTILLKPKEPLSHLAQDGFVGLRVVDHPLMQSLAESVRYPLTATSANLSGQEACLSPRCIKEKMPHVRCILGDNELQPTKPSTIMRLHDGDIEVVRKGSLSKDYLVQLI